MNWGLLFLIKNNIVLKGWIWGCLKNARAVARLLFDARLRALDCARLCWRAMPRSVSAVVPGLGRARVRGLEIPYP